MQEQPRWQRFVIEHGWRASAYELAAVLGQERATIEGLRRTGACRKLGVPKRFPELFALWHGRAPEDADWPKPRKWQGRGQYEWHGPELALLASLVGQMGPQEISAVLTSRLKDLTGDVTARRTKAAVLVRMNQIGLVTADVVGGITTTEAGKEIGSVHIVHQAIESKQLAAHRSGRLWVIPHDAWAKFKEGRTFPPAGYVPLASLKGPLGLKSDKLAEFARMGYVPTAVQCNPLGTGKNTQFGTWYVSPQTARKLKADRLAGRPMPWHGKPSPDNLKATFRKWQERKHPDHCATCAAIWGEGGAPKTFEEYATRYPLIEHGAKRHLTLPWSPGITLQEVATQSGRHLAYVAKAVINGMLAATLEGGVIYVTRTEATRWVARHCPLGDGMKSWLSLDAACKQYGFTMPELRALIASGQFSSRSDGNGGATYVLRMDCRRYRDTNGLTEEEAARRLKVSLPRLRTLLEGVNWRGATNIPLDTLRAVEKRLESRPGWDIEEAATELGTTVEWVEARLADGTARVSKGQWDDRRYLSAPQLERLRKAQAAPPTAPLPAPAESDLSLSQAALEAGVSVGTLTKWAAAGQVERVTSSRGWRYPRPSVRARAMTYWETVRFKRAVPPAWLGGSRAVNSAAAC